MLEICYNVILKSDRLSKKWTGKNMEKFNKLTGIAAPMPLVNIDTDMIIPKQFLKTIKRSGLGANLFDEMRFDQDGNEIADFVLNKKAYRNAEIIVAGENFGCGSSREHAPWALLDFGIKCVISTSYADIFYNNCFKNGILPIQIDEDKIKQISEYSIRKEEIKIDLNEQKIIFCSFKSILISSFLIEYSEICFIFSSSILIGSIPFLKQLL